MTIICADCKTRPAVLKRGKQSVCVACYEDKPPLPLAAWDRAMTPAYILTLEARIMELEKIISEWSSGK
ncbi:MAG: hypothetical protein DDT21_02302 [Syntrophomonadaceae bacterium]|nr:hypothetical protein [Bacillota bacterium]